MDGRTDVPVAGHLVATAQTMARIEEPTRFADVVAELAERLGAATEVDAATQLATWTPRLDGDAVILLRSALSGSLLPQLDVCLRYVEQAMLRPAVIVAHVGSGIAPSRPDLEAIASRVADPKMSVVTASLDRIGRNCRTVSEFVACLHSPDQLHLALLGFRLDDSALTSLLLGL